MKGIKVKSYGFGRSSARALAVLAACVLAGLAPGAVQAAQAAGAATSVTSAAAGRSAATGGPATALPAAGAYTTISGAGSSWSYPAINTWIGDVAPSGMTVNYNPVGSTQGRQEFKQGQVDFGASEIPYQLVDGNYSDPAPARKYAYIPDTAGGTTFMYNLHVGNAQITNLRLSGKAIADIFTGVITRWNDPVIKADNPGTPLPDELITPVVRSDGSGSTSEFTQWMIATQGNTWPDYCGKVNFSPCTQTSTYPVLPNSQMVGQPRDGGVAQYIANSKAEGAIGYVEYSYAIAYHFPVAKMLNAAGYYTLPTAGNVAVSLLQAQIDTTPTDPLYLTQKLQNVWNDNDQRTYPLSSYSYFILPEDLYAGMGFSTGKGSTLAQFGKFALCQGQTQVDTLGYSAVPYNLVFDGYNELATMPGATLTVPPSAEALAGQCGNPTFAPGHVNLLADTDPYPAACDKVNVTPCGTSTAVPPGGNPNGGGSSNSGGGFTNTGASNNPSTGTNNPSTGTASTGTGNSSTGTSGASAGTNGNGGGSGGSVASCDPNTGICSSGGTSGNGSGNGNGNGNGLAGAQTVNGVPVSSATSLGDGVQVVLMVLAAAMLLGLGLFPPLLAQAGDRRRQRRMDSYFDQYNRDGDR